MVGAAAAVAATDSISMQFLNESAGNVIHKLCRQVKG